MARSHGKIFPTASQYLSVFFFSSMAVASAQSPKRLIRGLLVSAAAVGSLCFRAPRRSHYVGPGLHPADVTSAAGRT